MITLNNIQAKAHVLSYGVKISDTSLKSFGEPFLCKRRAYSNMDDRKFTYENVPQEIVILPQQLVVGVVLREESPWSIELINNKYFLTRDGYENIEITFTQTPEFYGKVMPNGKKVESAITLLFGHTIGVFANTNCYFATIGKQCKYCSIQSNTARPKDLINQLDISTTINAIELAITMNSCVDCVFISGGNFNGFDENFKFYSQLALSVKKLIDYYKRDITVMLNVFPPKNIELIEILRDAGINVLVSTEVFDEDLFNTFCPGKAKILSKERLKKVLIKYLDVLGEYHVYSIVIQGLETENTLIQGIKDYASMGVCPIVNILHPDPGTEVYDIGIRQPFPEAILRVTNVISQVYSQYGFNSAQVYGGRSSFDKEASLGLLIQ
ncbi:hypothetical protein FACS189421_03750 [Bacteroidia bacterium]|nr:hypothetical protein FACS189421_03750 [Bacteroidia bacterium]